jgi:hypothetical protein
MGRWHNAFVFRDDGYVDVYEVYHGLEDNPVRTEEPVMTLIANDVEDLSGGLEQLLLDIAKGRYFESLQKLDQHCWMGGDDIE